MKLRGLLLLPYERPASERAFKQYERRPQTRLRQNYGPEGMALLAASSTGTRLAFGTGLVGLVVYGLSDFNGLGATLSYALLALTIALGCVAIVRGLQAGAAGRRFRGGRPYIRRPGRTF